ncbi:MAG: hypothetical protein EXR07_15770 [Acetobacteraceae bacterium]|nr:hypothetical protein [Acetobacteraceae bacterium]
MHGDNLLSERIVRAAEEQRVKHRLAGFACAAVLSVTVGAVGQSTLDARLRGQLDNAPVALEVACGALDREPCGKILAELSVRTSPKGVVLKQADPMPAQEAVSAVCEARIAAAIVPRDALARADCAERYAIVGPPLFPWYALLVVRADTSLRQWDDLFRVEPVTRPLTIATTTTSQAVLERLPPARREPVSVTNQAPDPALRQLTTGAIDAYLAVETLGGDLIGRVRGNPRHAFLELRPSQAFFRAGDGKGHCLYRTAALDFGTGPPLTTVSVDAVMILGGTFRAVHAKGGPEAATALTAAIEPARAAILSVTKSPPGWRPAASSCQ